MFHHKKMNSIISHLMATINKQLKKKELKYELYHIFLTL
jgi:hypothetical protein